MHCFSKTFDFLVEEYPWLSAKNVWNAAHKYNREPNWDKWVRDKWGLAANEDYQVPDAEKEGEPEWFSKFYAFARLTTVRFLNGSKDAQGKAPLDILVERRNAFGQLNAAQCDAMIEMFHDNN